MDILNINEKVQKILKFLEDNNQDSLDVVYDFHDIVNLMEEVYIDEDEIDDIKSCFNHKDVRTAIHKDFLEDYLNLEEKISIEHIEDITGFPLFMQYGSEYCLVSKESGECDSFQVNNKNDEEWEIYRPSHHQLLTEIHNFPIGYEDTFKFRVLLGILGFREFFPINIQELDNEEVYFTGETRDGEYFEILVEEEFKMLIKSLINDFY